jgi:hypothetical protein
MYVECILTRPVAPKRAIGTSHVDRPVTHVFGYAYGAVDDIQAFTRYQHAAEQQGIQVVFACEPDVAMKEGELAVMGLEVRHQLGID